MFRSFTKILFRNQLLSCQQVLYYTRLACFIFSSATKDMQYMPLISPLNEMSMGKTQASQSYGIGFQSSCHCWHRETENGEGERQKSLSMHKPDQDNFGCVPRLNDTQLNDIHHNNIYNPTLSIKIVSIMAECCYGEYHLC